MHNGYAQAEGVANLGGRPKALGLTTIPPTLLTVAEGDWNRTLFVAVHESGYVHVVLWHGRALPSMPANVC